MVSNKRIHSTEPQSEFLKRLLKEPSYGWESGGALSKPSNKAIGIEFFRNLNVIRDRRNWMNAWVVTMVASSFASLVIHLFYFASVLTLVLGLVYAFFVLPTCATFYLHRFGAHKAFQFSNSVARWIGSNLVIKQLPEEWYAIPHLVHHKFSDQAFDPHNPQCGWLYCYLADNLHFFVSRSLSEKEFLQASSLLKHTGVKLSTYAGYLKWGSLSDPKFLIKDFLVNWILWFSILYFLGGWPLVTAIFGFACVWIFLIKNFNYYAHGGGSNRKVPGYDLSEGDLAINQKDNGYAAGEWHSNHHCFPQSARSGFLPGQIDVPWMMVVVFYKLGLVKYFRDDTQKFLAIYESQKSAKD
jgi:fatty-acid desaturase